MYKGKNYILNGRFRVNFVGDMFDISSYWCSGLCYLVMGVGIMLYFGYILFFVYIKLC